MTGARLYNEAEARVYRPEDDEYLHAGLTFVGWAWRSATSSHWYLTVNLNRRSYPPMARFMVLFTRKDET